MDKASVLGDAIKYLKHLQERVKKLEEEGAKKGGGSKIIVKRTRLLVDDDHDMSSSDENSGGCFDKPLPEIEARVSGKDILIKIHCAKHKGHLGNALREVEKLHLSILDSSVLQFGSSTVDISIVAQVYIYTHTFHELLRHIDTLLVCLSFFFSLFFAFCFCFCFVLWSLY